MNALTPFVGIWNTTGKIWRGDGEEEQRLVATDIYEWLPGKGFLLHRADARLGDEVARSVEIIGWDDEAAEIFSASYDDQGATSQFQCALDGREWRIDGKGIRFRGAFNQGWSQLTGTWERESQGSWSSWMDISLIKAD
ncbi:MAG: hypothetical protein AAFY56_23965 [Pseudomonadota bacterium]